MISANRRHVLSAAGEVVQPNGLCFSPDYSLLYVAGTGSGDTKVWDVDRTRLRNGRRFTELELPGGGAKRNRLFMTASQSLDAVYAGVSGARIC